MISGSLLILGIVLFALLLLVSLIFTIIYFAYSKRGKFIWLGIFFISIAGLVLSIYLTVNKVVSKAVDFVQNVDESIKNSIGSSSDESYNYADTLGSEQIRALKQMEPDDAKGNVPSEFYHYLGFRDYYRLPLVYPYSIHCIDVVDIGDLYNEKNVQKFDENDNGDESCGLRNIIEFAFNSKMLLVRTETEEGNVKKEKFEIYDFETGKKMEFEKKDEMLNVAKKLGYEGIPDFHTPRQYFGLF